MIFGVSSEINGYHNGITAYVCRAAIKTKVRNESIRVFEPPRLKQPLLIPVVKAPLKMIYNDMQVGNTLREQNWQLSYPEHVHFSPQSRWFQGKLPSLLRHLRDPSFYEIHLFKQQTTLNKIEKATRKVNTGGFALNRFAHAEAER